MPVIGYDPVRVLDFDSLEDDAIGAGSLVGTALRAMPGMIASAVEARTGERLAVLGPSSGGASLPGSVRVIGEDELAAGRRAWIFEEVGGKRLRLSAQSFFQASPEGAEVLVSLVGSAIAGAPDGLLVDAYGGVGLFAATVGASRPVTLLECSAPAAADARVNLPAASVRLIDVARWRCGRSCREQSKPSGACLVRTGLPWTGRGPAAG